MDTNETRQDPVDMLIKYMEWGQQDLPVFDERCKYMLPVSAIAI